MRKGYPFHFIRKNFKGADSFMEYTLEYAFVSEKSDHFYQVKFEKYFQNTYCVKFSDLAFQNGSQKYILNSNTYEPLAILYTVYDIAFDVLRRDEKASFFFIGARDAKDRQGMPTRRFNVYQYFVDKTVPTELFHSSSRPEYSLIVLSNLKYVDDHELFADGIVGAIRLFEG